MKKISELFILLILTLLVIYDIYITKELEYHQAQLERDAEIIEEIGYDLEEFNNMHADHYAFEEYKILQLIDDDKAIKYKTFLDSIKTNGN